MVMGRAAPGDQRLRGRVGIITGAASGIGAAGADLFAAHGAALVLLDQDPAGGQRVADGLTQAVGAPVRLALRGIDSPSSSFSGRAGEPPSAPDVYLAARPEEGQDECRAKHCMRILPS